MQGLPVLKLEDLRSHFETSPELETGPKCICCERSDRELVDHPEHGAVCVVCREFCYDILADAFKHGVQNPVYDPKQLCVDCGRARLAWPDHVSGKWVLISPCENCAAKAKLGK